jgi:hypothetical protein
MELQPRRPALINSRNSSLCTASLNNLSINESVNLLHKQLYTFYLTEYLQLYNNTRIVQDKTILLRNETVKVFRANYFLSFQLNCDLLLLCMCLATSLPNGRTAILITHVQGNEFRPKAPYSACIVRVSLNKLFT